LIGAIAAIATVFYVVDPTMGSQQKKKKKFRTKSWWLKL
jgi:hypothetical protein